ncbi:MULTISPECIES: NUDIX hydrolase [Dactylosporangium]|uniref:NUDIX hydrolase n=2 Tax=Dactylosporangium TaxID=35753 RepID=A0A9W6KNF1_9ACTN|nr:MULTISPECIES: NUDIX domain-containing protein [Dactylosporangium]UAB95788.1 NUDIX domain-containing protein [Dactylosporangium vinaceum]UWZ44144.1 NUDIX domain-containing protein [Dactylosporangium matsuzakiense]GLL03425.1 NUDIX hydrolase [Dactylosporangium matsuzakiense]
MSLHENALAVLEGWEAPSAEAEATRKRFLEFVFPDPTTVLREHAGGHVTASALIVDAAAERVLLCLHGRINRWVQLGGHCEPEDTTIAGAALREATEESGILGLRISEAPINLDVHPVLCSGGQSFHYDIRYAAIAPAGAVEKVSAESNALGWFAPDDLPSPLADATEVLVAPALAWAKQG